MVPFIQVTPQIFVYGILASSEFYAFISFIVFWSLRRVSRPTKIQGNSRLRILVFWLTFSPLILYGLLFLLPDLFIFISGLLLMIITWHLVYVWQSEDHVMAERLLPKLLASGIMFQYEICFMPMAIYNLFSTTIQNFLLLVIVSIVASGALVAFDLILIRVIAKKKLTLTIFKGVPRE